MAHPALSFGPFLVTPVGLVVQGEPTFEEWQRLYDGLARLDDFSNWAIGDAEAFTRPKYGEAADQLTANWPEHEYNKIKQCRWVAEKVKFGTRVPNLSWSHHREVGRLPEEQQREWLSAASEGGWSVQELRTAIRRARLAPHALGLSVRPTLYCGDMLEILPHLGEFDCVVTDPPYGVGANFDSQEALEWDDNPDYLDDAGQWLATIATALKPEYNLFWFCSSKKAADTELVFRKLGLPIQSRIVWEHRSLTKGRKVTGKFMSTWDMVLHAGNRDLNFPAEWSDAWFDVQHFEIPTSVGKGIDAKVHETQKPAGLIERLVTFGSFPGDRVLDPFAGSGTVGTVCPPDRECILVEKEEAYCEVIEKRLSIRRNI